MTRQSTMKDGTDAVVANDAPAAPVRNGPARPKPSKKEQLIRLLSAKAGADTGTISCKLGWQPHTVRAALSGLRKAGYDVEGERPGEGRAVRYRILAAPAAAEPASAIATGRA